MTHTEYAKNGVNTMNKLETKIAIDLIASVCDRVETISLDTGGKAITAHWRNGGQKIFYSVDDVFRQAYELAESRLVSLGFSRDMSDDPTGQVSAADHLAWLLSASDDEITNWGNDMSKPFPGCDFSDENTRGYTPAQLGQLNSEWERIVALEKIDEDGPEWKARQERLLRDFDQRHGYGTDDVRRHA